MKVLFSPITTLRGPQGCLRSAGAWLLGLIIEAIAICQVEAKPQGPSTHLRNLYSSAAPVHMEHGDSVVYLQCIRTPTCGDQHMMQIAGLVATTTPTPPELPATCGVLARALPFVDTGDSTRSEPRGTGATPGYSLVMTSR